MFLSMLKSKLHKAVATGANPDYEGSITIDESLMRASKLIEHEKVLVANLRNGNRFETYVIPAKRGSGIVCLNGAAALLGAKGDRLIILSFMLLSPARAKRHKPTVIVLDESNRPVSRKPAKSKR